MSEQGISPNPIFEPSIDDAGLMSEQESSSRPFSEVDTGAKEGMADNKNQDPDGSDVGERPGILRDILLLNRADVPSMAYVVYGCDTDEVSAVIGEDVKDQSREQRGRRRKGSGSKSCGSSTRILREADGRRLTPLWVEPYGAGPSLRESGQRSAAVDAGANEVEDSEIRGRRTSRSGSPSESQRRLPPRCEVCKLERSAFIRDLAQKRAATSLAAGEEGARIDGALQQRPWAGKRPRDRR